MKDIISSNFDNPYSILKFYFSNSCTLTFRSKPVLNSFNKNTQEVKQGTKYLSPGIFIIIKTFHEAYSKEFFEAD